MEKKLTDEEVVKVLEECFVKVGKMKCKECKIHNGEGLRDCMKNVAVDTLDLIHRLQFENERLKKEKYQVEQNLEQCENGYELELHTARYDMRVNREKVDELQKQVDELKENQVIECHGMLKGCDMVKQAVKDTAKEIIVFVEEKDKKAGKYSIYRTLLQELKERYEVER